MKTQWLRLVKSILLPNRSTKFEIMWSRLVQPSEQSRLIESHSESLFRLILFLSITLLFPDKSDFKRQVEPML